jgi:molybdenum cofactor biosynthesis enzyme MoaA
MKGIDKALEMKFESVKVNVVMMKNFNEDVSDSDIGVLIVL